MRGHLALLVMVLVGFNSEGVQARTQVDDGLRIPRGFEAFEPALRARYAGSRQLNDEDIVDCSKASEPSVPQNLPSWAEANVDELRTRRVEELINAESRRPMEAFVSGSELVIKKCTAVTLETVALRVRPAASAEKGDLDPSWDIYFDCGDSSRNFTIWVKNTIEFGRASKTAFGSFRLLVLDQNVVLDGGNKNRIMRILSGAHVTTYGLTFRRGYAGNPSPATTDDIPAGGWNGAAVLIMYKGALVAYRTKFIRNTSVSVYARWGGGAAIKCETESFALVWGCDFEGNDATAGGAIATSSANVLQVIDSTFTGNIARGGIDGSTPETSLKAKPVVLVRGAAIRVDSASSIVGPDEHVLICGSKFTRNKLIFTTTDLPERFGYAADELGTMRAAGAAVTLWNSPENLATVTDNQHFLSMQSCDFLENEELVEPEGDKLGRYVFEVMGAGHCKIERCNFVKNKVNHAVLKLDNSERWQATEVVYENTLKDLKFSRNGDLYNLDFEPPKFESVCIFRDVDGVPDGRGDCANWIQDAADSGGNLSIIEGDGYDDPSTIPSDSELTLFPTPTATPESTPLPSDLPGFVKCGNTFGDEKCAGLAANGRCTKPDVAKNCALACAMCPVCVDFNSKVCTEAAKYGRCSTAMYASNCSMSCGNCQATPTPTPSPTPTNAPGFEECENTLGNAKCSYLTDKCDKPDTGRGCALACGMCPVCVDFNGDACRQIVDNGQCSIRKYAARCPASCGLCNPTPSPTPSPVPTPDPDFQPCANVLGNGHCADLEAAGRCIKHHVARECALACGMCPLCVDYNEDVCRKVSESGGCSVPQKASVCPKSCGKCNPAPTPTPSPIPTPGPQFELCMNELGNTNCRDLQEAGRCSRPHVATGCALACEMCPTCIDFNEEVCHKILETGQCSNRTDASKCPKSCGKCNPTPTPTPSPTPMVPADFVRCTNTVGNTQCSKLAAAGQCNSSEVARDCALACEMCPVCVDYHEDACRNLVNEGRCSTRSLAQICPASCGKCNSVPSPTPSPTPTSTPAPTAAPGFQQCQDVFELSRCTNMQAKGKCTKASGIDNCALTCGTCPVCVDFSAELCLQLANTGRCSNKNDSAMCPASCGLCLTATPTSTPTPTAAPGFQACENVLGSTQCANKKAKGLCGRADVSRDCKLTCGMCPVCIDYNEEMCREVVDKGKCGTTRLSSQCPASCGKCGGTPTPTPSPTPFPTAAPGFQACGNILGTTQCQKKRDLGLCSRPDVAAACLLTCGMCPACVDYNADVCRQVVEKGKCFTTRLSSQCPASCGKCGPTPTPSA